jgi:hypothetical protein
METALCQGGRIVDAERDALLAWRTDDAAIAFFGKRTLAVSGASPAAPWQAVGALNDNQSGSMGTAQPTG